MGTSNRNELTLAGLGLLPLAFAWKGYVLSTVWGWFIASQFGAPTLTIAQAIGIALFVGLLTYQHRPADPDLTLFKIVAHSFTTPALTLGFAWIVRGFL